MLCRRLVFFFFNDTATTEIYTLSLHDALPISARIESEASSTITTLLLPSAFAAMPAGMARSEEHTSELQSPCNLVCRLLLEKKKNKDHTPPSVAGRRPIHIPARTCIQPTPCTF